MSEAERALFEAQSKLITFYINLSEEGLVEFSSDEQYAECNRLEADVLQAMRRLELELPDWATQ